MLLKNIDNGLYKQIVAHPMFWEGKEKRMYLAVMNEDQQVSIIKVEIDEDSSQEAIMEQ